LGPILVHAAGPGRALACRQPVAQDSVTSALLGDDMLPAIAVGTGEPWAVAAPKQDGVFRIGLALAGTVSAAAYTAGVIDYVIEALDEWERQKAEDTRNGTRTVPHHRVILDVISGTSGGGITAAITAAALHSDFVCGRCGDPAPPPAKNKLYDTWVQQIDLSKLLTTDDVEALAENGGALGSLLNSAALDRLANGVLDMDAPKPGDAAFHPGTRQRKWVTANLHVLITSTNLLGTPYVVNFAGTSEAAGYPMLTHANYMQFVVSSVKLNVAWAECLDPALLGPGAATRAPWSLMRDAALATSAFPLGFRARWLTQKAGWYSSLNWIVPGEADEQVPTKVEPDWLNDYAAPPAEVKFLNVDGGVINNEPFEYTRSVLAGAGHHNPRNVAQADRAVIMIDPLFRANPGADRSGANGAIPGRIAKSGKDSLAGVAGTLLGAMIAQQRFKPTELALALAENVYSRYLVVPAPAADASGKRYAYPIFGELLGAFAAFVNQRLREYDYALGRRNAQRFLKRHFAISERNPLYAEAAKDPAWPRIRDAQAAQDGGGPVEIEQYERDGTSVAGTRQRLMRIIPICGTAVAEAKVPDRAAILAGEPFAFRDALAQRATSRADAVFAQLRGEFLSAPDGAGVWARVKKWGLRRVAGLGWSVFAKGRLLDMIGQKFTGAAQQAAEAAPPKRVRKGTKPFTGWRIVR
jgi:hypothetical protein